MTSRLEAMRAREQAATPGPWYSATNGVWWDIGTEERVPGMRVATIPYDLGPGQDADNADFVTNSRADMAVLLAVAEAAAAAWPRMLALFEFLATHGYTTPVAEIVAFRGALEALQQDVPAE